MEDAAYVRDCGSGNHLAPAKLPRKQQRREGQQGKQWQGPGSSLQVCCLILPKRNPSQTRKLKLEVIVPCPRSDSGNMPCTYVPGRVDGYTSTGGHEARCSCQKCHSPCEQHQQREPGDPRKASSSPINLCVLRRLTPQTPRQAESLEQVQGSPVGHPWRRQSSNSAPGNSRFKKTNLWGEWLKRRLELEGASGAKPTGYH